MKNKISNKLYGALLRCGTPQDLAAKFARTADFLGESTEETVERDNYEIMITAKALASLISRHSAVNEDLISEIAKDVSLSAEEDETIDKTAERTVISPVTESYESKENFADDYPVTGKVKKESSFWRLLEQMPRPLRSATSIVLPILMYIGMILLTVIVVGLIGACILSMIGVTILGIVLFIVGLLYGVSQLSTFPAAAYYEIGLGLVLGGISSLLIVLMYNVITRLLPFVIKIGFIRLNSVSKGFRRFRAALRQKALETGSN